MTRAGDVAPGSGRACVNYRTYLGLGRLHAEISDRPGRTGPCPWLYVITWRNAHDHIERITSGPRFADLADQLGQRRGAGQAGGEQALPPQRPPHRPPMRPLRRHPYGDPRLLQRNRLELPGPVPDQVAEALIEQPGPLARIGDLAERFELAVSRAGEPDPEGEAARAQQVQADRLPGHLMHAPTRQRRD